MLLRNPCKKCIVRACCTQVCDDKIKQVNLIELMFYNNIYNIKDNISNAFSWVKHKWPEILGISIILIEIGFIILLSTKVYKPL